MLNRRGFIRQLGSLASGGVIGSSLLNAAQTVQAQPAPQAQSAQGEPRVPDFRIAHLTDMHVMPDGAMSVNAQAGFIRALEHSQNLSRKPDLILQGGDGIMDALRTGKAEVAAQWQAFQEALKKHLKTPIRHAIGNHDCWTGPASKNDPLYGKAWALKEYKLEKPYYAFEAGNWHVIVLDSTNLETKDAHGYMAKLDEPQFKWLEKELAATPKTKPVLVMSHIPILAVSPFLDGDNETSGNWVVPGAWMHIDARRIKNLFAAHSNVRLCLSGHIHLRDSAVYNGVTYACNGAVCGNWWRGNYQETKPGYAVVDLYNDGQFKIDYLQYDA
jgi:3',5'-cyclic-AMP phosphodiesterase